MKNIFLTTLIAFCGVAVSAQSYAPVPEAFWSDTDTLNEVLPDVYDRASSLVPDELYRKGDSISFSKMDEILATKTIEFAYPIVEKFMTERNLQVPTQKEVFDSFGIFSTIDPETQLETLHMPRENVEKFLNQLFELEEMCKVNFLD